MTDKALLILKQLSEKSHTIVRLIEENSELLAICEDYDVCIKALKHWEQSEEPEAKTRVNEYKTLIKELEKEIREALEPHLSN